MNLGKETELIEFETPTSQISQALDNYNILYLVTTDDIDNIKSQIVVEHCDYRFICDKT